MKKFFGIILAAFLCCSCNGGNGRAVESVVGDTLNAFADYLCLVELNENVTAATILDPWNDRAALGRYLLVDRTLEDDEVPTVEGYTVIRVPVNSALVYSSVHSAPLEELDAADCITGVADADFFRSPAIRRRLSQGKIVNIGNSMSPSFEQIVSLNPEIALVSPYQNAGHGILERTDIKVIDMADYMETTPAGRAEWILLLGKLTGKYDRAKEIFDRTVNTYDSIKAQVTRLPDRPLVVTEVPYGGVWYQPGARSYMATLIRDAGGRTVSDDDAVGSVQYDIANVFDLGHDADVWIIKTTAPMTYGDLREFTPLVEDFKAFKNRNVWVANTAEVDLYDDLAFHPEYVLADYVRIFHPDADLRLPAPKRYFSQMK